MNGKHFWVATLHCRLGASALRSLLGLVWLVLAPAAAAQPPPATAAELESLAAETMRLYGEGQLAEAAASGERILAALRASPGENDGDLVNMLEWLADAYQQIENWPAAESRLSEALALREASQGADHWQTNYTRLGLRQVRLLQTLSADERHRLKQAAFANAEAERLARERRYEEALRFAEQALAARREILGEEHQDSAQSLHYVAVLYHSLGDYDRAEPLYRRASDLCREVLGDQHPDYATSLSGLASLYRDSGDYVQAESLYQRSAEIRKAAFGDRHPIFASSIHDVATIHHHRGDYARAEPLYRQASAIWKEVLGEKHPHYAENLANLADVYCALGEFARAEQLYRQALGIMREVLGEKDMIIAGTLNSLAELYRAMDDYARAEPLYRQAIEISKAVGGDSHPNVAANLNNLAELYRVMGDFARAEPLYWQASEIYKAALGPTHPYFATSLHNLALLYLGAGDLARAETLCRQSLSISETAHRQQHPDYAASLNVLAAVHYANEDFVQAEALCRQALAVNRDAFDEQHPEYARSLNALGETYRAMGAFAQAEPLLRQALDITRQTVGEQHTEYASSLYNLASLDHSRKNYDRAALHYRQALEAVVGLAHGAAVVQDEFGQLLFSQNAQFMLESYVSCLLRTDGGAEAAYRAVVNWKGATLVRQRAARRMAIDDDGLTSTLAELQSVVRQWTALAGGARQGDVRWQERLDELAQRKQRLEAALIAGSAAYRAATAQVQPSDVGQALPEGTVLVDYWEFEHIESSPDQPGKISGPRSLLAFVVRRDHGVQMINLGDVAPIYAAIDLWRLSYGATPQAHDAGRLLRERLWAPLADAIGDASLVIVSPDGALGKLPFAALPGARPDSFLIEDVALALAPVPQLIPTLAAGERQRARDKELLLVGGVDYDRRDRAIVATELPAEERLAVTRRRGAARRTANGLHWDALPGADGEAAAIGELFRTFGGFAGDAVVRLGGAAATEEQFRALAPQCRILHVATHGFFAPEDRRSAMAVVEPEDSSLLAGALPISGRLNRVGFSPGLLSGLVLAGANDRIALPEDPAQIAELPEDGILTADELAFLPLGGVELAVLSACETGLGKVAGSEGLLGIQRAFHVAGVRTTIASLWKVDDAWTQRLMTLFYRNALEGGQPYLEALRNAQLEILQQLRGDGAGLSEELRGADGPADAMRGEPYYWAAFTLSGDWR